jgi:catechol 2,3-dioxygenase-like lactoylglutathione lyase family enzyme
VEETKMQARIHVVTLAVDDLERAVAFYRALGLVTPGIVGTEFIGDEHNPGGAAAMFELDGGLILSVFGRGDLAKDAEIPVGSATSGAFSLGHLVSSRHAVEATLKEAVAAGAEALAGPHERPWGIYSAYFRDPDGHLWEIIWNPSFDLANS